MESPYHSPAHVDASRPSIGFPLGTALLLLFIFTLSGVVSCCYHWEKLRSLRRSFAGGGGDLEAGSDGSPSKPRPGNTSSKQSMSQSLPVLMPGDEIPKFIALPCPCRPPMPEKIIVQVQEPPQKPSIAAMVPFY
ncbi:hypothetical protein NMG60_11028679 [Bertholletia excelsa]